MIYGRDVVGDLYAAVPALPDYRHDRVPHVCKIWGVFRGSLPILTFGERVVGWGRRGGIRRARFESGS
jgi:hypothetical protein